jgi:hypothetical protein
MAVREGEMKPDFELTDIASEERAKQYETEQKEIFEAKRTEIIQENGTWTLRVWY